MPIFLENIKMRQRSYRWSLVVGKLIFSKFTPLKYDVMGPFRYIPFMQCRHSVFSLAHNIKGNNAIMISVADIPIGKISFKGCIGLVYYG